MCDYVIGDSTRNLLFSNAAKLIYLLIMISPFQADKIIDEILMQARLIRDVERNFKCARIPIIYRISELESIEPWLRVIIVHECKKATIFSFLVIVLWLMSVALILIVVAAGLLWHAWGAITSFYFGGFGIIGMLPVRIFTVHLIRRRIRNSVSSMPREWKRIIE